MKFLLSIFASAVIMTATATTATAIDTQKTVKEVPQAIKVNVESEIRESEIIARRCPPLCA